MKSGWSDYDATHVQIKDPEIMKHVLNHEKKRPVKLTKNGQEICFESCSEASRFLGYNKGYLVNVWRKRKKDEFMIGGYHVEMSERCY